MAEFSIGRVASCTAEAALAVTAALALAACGGGAHVPQVASLGGNSGGGSSTPHIAIPGNNAAAGHRRRAAATTPPKGNPTRLVDEWAACERSHGDANQADPTIDTHGVINITIPMGAVPAGDPHDVTGACSGYLAAAQSALRAADPVPDPLGMDNQTDLLKYVNCMRASGVPNYPYPTGNTTNFNGTGVDPTSPSVVKVSIECGNKLGLPLWWSAGWGPPGDVTVSTTPPPGAHVRGPLVPGTGGSNGDVMPGPAVSGATSGANTGG